MQYKMRASTLPILPFLVLCASILLLLLNISVVSFRSSTGGNDELLPSLQLFDGISVPEEQIEDIGYASEDSEKNGSNDYHSHCGSSGYEQDNDDNHSDSEIDWIEDDEETDHDLENKVEAFISKVIQGWKEELMSERTTLTSELLDM